MRNKILSGFEDNVNNFDENDYKRLAKSALDMANSFAYHGDRENIRKDLERILALSGLDVNLDNILSPKDKLYFNETETQELFKKLQEIGLIGAFFLNGKTLYLYPDENKKPDEKAINDLLRTYSDDYVKTKVGEVENNYKRKLKSTKRKLSESKKEFSSGYRLDEVVRLFNHSAISQGTTDSGGIHITYNAPVNYGTIYQTLQSRTPLFTNGTQSDQLRTSYPTFNGLNGNGQYQDQNNQPEINPERKGKLCDLVEDSQNKASNTTAGNSNSFSVWPLLLLALAIFAI